MEECGAPYATQILRPVRNENFFVSSMIWVRLRLRLRLRLKA